MPLHRSRRKAAKLAAFWLLLLLVAGCGSASSGSSGEMAGDSGIPVDQSDSGRLPSQDGSDCAPGTYVSSPPSETSPRACAACPSGTFSSAANAPRCDAFRPCPIDSYVSRAGSPTTDQACAPCDPGTTTTGPNQASCVPKDSCPAGTTHREGGSPVDCDVCPPGSYCPGGGVPKVVCPANTWDNDNDPATPCAAATECLAGQRVFAEPTPLSDRACVACPSGSFSVSKNTATCTDLTHCEAGSFVSQPGTSVSDRVRMARCRPDATKPRACHKTHVPQARAKLRLLRRTPRPSALHARQGITARAAKLRRFRARLGPGTTISIPRALACHGADACRAKAFTAKARPSRIEAAPAA
jgi:hypothetical protein